MKTRDLQALLADALLPLPPPPALKARLMASLRAQPLAKISRVRGSFELEGQRQSAPMPLKEGAWITAPLSARLEVLIPGKVVVLLVKGAKARLHKIGEAYQMILESGEALIHVMSGTRFSMQLPLGEVFVKGTYFYTAVEGANKNYVCLCEGWVAVKGKGFKTELRADKDTAIELLRKPGKTEFKKTRRGHPHFALSPLE